MLPFVNFDIVLITSIQYYIGVLVVKHNCAFTLTIHD